MTKIIRLLILCSLLATGHLSLAAEENEQPTREKVIAFLEECLEKMPLTKEEEGIAWRDREKIDLVKQFGKDFTGLDLSGIAFYQKTRGFIALDADFSRCNLRDSILSNAVLNGSRFVDADLNDTDFTYADLENTDFTDAHLEKTRFYGAEMPNATFAHLKATRSEFQFVNFQGARLMGTDFSGVDFGGRGEFQNADLSGANMSHASLNYADFSEATLKNVRLNHANLRLARFVGADLEGADFTDANLESALLTDVKGIDRTQLDSLERRAARWRYDLKVGFFNFLKTAYRPTYLAIAILVSTFALIGLSKKEKKTISFIAAVCLNGFALFSTFTTFLMMFSGGHPVRQMSQGNREAWSNWLHFYPIPLFGLMLCILLAVILMLVVIVQLIVMRGKFRPWTLFFYQALTLVHCLFAFNWLIMFMPDA